MIRKVIAAGILYDSILLMTTGGTYCHHYIDCDKTVPLLVRLKNSKYFKGKRKLELIDDCNDLEGAIKNYESLRKEVINVRNRKK